MLTMLLRYEANRRENHDTKSGSELDRSSSVWCPLLSLQEAHFTYIDRDTLGAAVNAALDELLLNLAEARAPV